MIAVLGRHELTSISIQCVRLAGKRRSHCLGRYSGDQLRALATPMRMCDSGGAAARYACAFCYHVIIRATGESYVSFTCTQSGFYTTFTSVKSGHNVRNTCLLNRAFFVSSMMHPTARLGRSSINQSHEMLHKTTSRAPRDENESHDRHCCQWQRRPSRNNTVHLMTNQNCGWCVYLLGVGRYVQLGLEDNTGYFTPSQFHSRIWSTNKTVNVGPIFE